MHCAKCGEAHYYSLLFKGNTVTKIGQYPSFSKSEVQSLRKYKNSLVDDRSGSYGDEAINAIVQEMENHREDVVVIFAGYPDKMEGFLQKKPGLRSRIAFYVPFADYKTDELCSIANLIAKKKGLKLTEDACEKLTEIFSVARTESDFGNGRYVRNVIEKANMAHATRLLKADLDFIDRNDIVSIQKEAEQRLGKKIAAYDLIIRAKRLCKLMSLNAPEVIIYDEAKILAQAMAIHDYAKSLVPVEAIS